MFAIPGGFRFTPSNAGGSNVCEVTVQATYAPGPPFDNAAMFGVFLVQLWLSDDSDGLGLTATTADGGVTNATGGGLVVSTNVTDKSLLVQTRVDGRFVLSITDSAKTGFFVCVQNPADGRTIVSRRLTSADYGT